jgi:hypothetical protein
MMTVNWEKKGIVFEPNSRYPWMHCYAQNPNAILLKDVVRVFFNCRPRQSPDGNWSSYIGFVDLSRGDLSRIARISEHPVLDHGEIGAFDQFGTMSGSTVVNGERIFNYYVGWSQCKAVPYNWAIGIAVSLDGGESFSRLGRGPVIGPSVNEPFLQNAPYVSFINGQWHCWYSSGITWIVTGDKAESVYQIMHATSDDGIYWKREGVPVIAPVVEHECQTSATVIRIGEKYHMWFSWRHGLDFRNPARGYRLGYAWSSNLTQWHRDDNQAGLTISPHGWDSEMICYPHVTRVDQQLVMFYCGNYFGRDGFGYAVAPVAAFESK